MFSTKTALCKTRKFHPVYQNREEPKIAGVACNFIKKETLAQVFSFEFCEISKNTFFYRTPLVAASVYSRGLWCSLWWGTKLKIEKGLVNCALWWTVWYWKLSFFSNVLNQSTWYLSCDLKYGTSSRIKHRQKHL